MNSQKGKKILTVFVKLICIALIFSMGVSLIVGGALAIYVNKKIERDIDETLFSLVGSGTDTKIYYYDTDEDTGKTVAVELDESLWGGYRSVYADYEAIPKDLINAFVSIEDKRFFEHHGVDWFRTVSATLNYFLKFSNSFGGSTITQQLIKNITDKDDYSFQRKIQEIFWALNLETKMNKEEILGLYLNIINLSQGCYGVAAASEKYFSKDISELTLNECACIAAITNNPSYYDPINNPQNNKSRKDIILTQMYEQGYITENEYKENKGKDVVLNISDKYGADGINSWYVDMVVEDVISDLMSSRGYSREMANLVVYTGGVKIYTAMNPEIQSIVEKYYSKTSNFYSRSNAENPQSSMIIIDPKNGDILAVAGAVGEKKANRIQNFATQTLRPPGSVIKPLSVYAPALEDGIISYASVYDDVPVNFGNGNNASSTKPIAWPKNSDGIYRGLTNINYAIEHSINTVTVRVLEDIGAEKAFNFLYDKLNIKSLIKDGSDEYGRYITDMDVAAMALGQTNYGVTVREITAAYSIFANDGIYNACRSYYKVTDSYGSILLENQYKGSAVISSETASIMGKMLENVVSSGTAKAITLDESVPCAGKTGTTQNNYDRWYIGYTPELIGGVWYGYEYPKALSGSNICINIWDAVMSEIYMKTDLSRSSSFNYSENITEAEYCKDSGLLMTEACRLDARGDRAEKGYFIKGKEPTEYCDCHVKVLYDKTEGGVAMYGMCKYGEIDYVGMITVERSFPIQIYVSDAQYVYRTIDRDTVPESSPELPFFNNAAKKNEYFGVSDTEEQFNRLCRAHFNYLEWLEKRDMLESG